MDEYTPKAPLTEVFPFPHRPRARARPEAVGERGAPPGGGAERGGSRLCWKLCVLPGGGKSRVLLPLTALRLLTASCTEEITYEDPQPGEWQWR